MSSVVAKHESPRSMKSWAPLILIGGVLLGAAGFSWSQHLEGSGEVVAARVALDGIDVGGMTERQVKRVVSDHSEDVLDQIVTIEFEGGQARFSLLDLGFRYDQAATVDNVMETRRSGGPIAEMVSWVTTPFMVSSADVAWALDSDVAREVLAETPALTPKPPIEPAIAANGRGILRARPGEPGMTVDVDAVIAGLRRIDPLEPPRALSGDLVLLAPTVTDDDAESAVANLNDLTATGVLTSLAGRSIRLSPEQLRSQLEIRAREGAIEVSFDLAGLQEGIENLYPEPIRPTRKPVLEVVDGAPRVVKVGKPPMVCCSEGSAEAVAEMVLSGESEPFVAVPLQARAQDDPDILAWVDGSQIVEQVSSFTTPHACCETRVANIQRMADIVDNYYLLPGEALSLNEFVGPRTEENGFVAAGAIRRGHLIQEVGGGVSQFATTIFNAAYFAGLDFDEYRSHTIYFSRYPYGREATISNPAPDLIIRNTTPYPVLIDTSYDDTSITVSMFSTRHARVEELEQRVSKTGACTHVETDRQRTYPDGRVVVDTFFADYRPAEGIDCSGNRIPRPN